MTSTAHSYLDPGHTLEDSDEDGPSHLPSVSVQMKAANELAPSTNVSKVAKPQVLSVSPSLNKAISDTSLTEASLLSFN